MSAPSATHEVRVDHLKTLAALACCRSPVKLGGGLAPDVARVDLARNRLLVGDAKVTETAGCVETHRRLRRYLRVARVWTARGYSVRLAVYHSPPDSSWRRQLERDARACGLGVMASGSSHLTSSEIVSWVDVGSSTKTEPPTTIPSGGSPRR